jgi:hypothetical protein
VVVPAAEVEDPVDDVEEDLSLEGKSPRAGLPGRCVRRDDDLAEEPVVLVLEREAHDVGRSGDAQEVHVDPRDRTVVHEGDREPPSPLLGIEHRGGERLDARRIAREAALLGSHVDPAHGRRV